MMKSHFNLTQIFFCYTMLYAGCCKRSTKKNKEDSITNAEMPHAPRTHKVLKQNVPTTNKNVPATSQAEMPPNLLIQDSMRQTGSRQAYRLDKPSRSSPEAARTQDMRNQVKQALNAGAKTVLTKIANIEIRQEDLTLLEGSGWLNDNLINAYIHMIQNRSKEKVMGFNTFFFRSLSNNGYLKVKNWTKHIDIFKYQMILVPIHLTNHWCLAVIDLHKKTISYYDSLRGTDKGNDYLDKLLNYLMAEATDKKKQQLNKEEWTLKYLENIPQQENANDCGVFVCKFADCVTRNAEINFTQSDIADFRQRMAFEILTNKLI